MNKIIKNVLTGFIGQLIIIFLGIIVPRIFIKNYGSDVNGLFSTVTQIFAYVALLEAGIGQATKNALYKPLTHNNISDINYVYSLSDRYFKKFTVYYAICVIILSILAPFFIISNVDKKAIFIIFLLEGTSGVINFYFVQVKSLVIDVDGKAYINNTINLISKFFAYMTKIIMALQNYNIILLEVVFCLLSVFKAILYNYYFLKHYKKITIVPVKHNDKLKDRNSFILNELAWTLFSSTDMIVLSTFLGTKYTSVYAVYNMIFSNINILMQAVYNSLTYILGREYSRDLNKYSVIHDSFNSIFIGGMTILMSVTYCLCLPFIKLYTNGINDINYIYTSLPIMFCLVQLLSWSRMVNGNLTGLGGYAKSTSYVSVIEAAINLLLSIILVPIYGIAGVLFATVIALPIKVVWCIYISDRKILHRSIAKTVQIIAINFIFFFGVVVCSKFFQPSISSFYEFFLWGLVFSLLLGMIGIGLNLLVNRDCLRIVRRYILKR